MLAVGQPSSNEAPDVILCAVSDEDKVALTSMKFASGSSAGA